MAQVYAIRQALAKSLVAYYQKREFVLNVILDLSFSTRDAFS